MERFLFKFRIRFRNIGRKLKNIQTNSKVSISIKFQCVIGSYCISMDSSLQALQTYESFFTNFEIIFQIN